MAVVFKTNANGLAARQRFRGKQVDAAMQAQARLWGQQVKARATALSQGTLSASRLRGYKPGLYSTRRAGNPAFDAVVNKQSGLLARSWTFGVWSFTGHVTVTVFNTAPYSGYLMGTARMRMRPILAVATGAIPFGAMMLKAKRQAEQSSTGGSLVLELVQVAATVGVAYGGAAMG